MMPVRARELYYDDVTVGAELPPKTIRLNVPLMVRWSTTVELFTRRDHFDLGYVQKHTDLKDIVASGDWTHIYILHYMKSWAGTEGWVWKVNHQHRAFLYPGDVLTAWGRVSNAFVKNGLGYVELDAGLRRQQDGGDVVPATGVVVLPLRGGKPVPYPFHP